MIGIDIVTNKWIPDYVMVTVSRCPNEPYGCKECAWKGKHIQIIKLDKHNPASKGGVMEDKPVCPWCGTKEVENYGLGSPIYQCATSNNTQSWCCKKIAILQAQVAGMREGVKKVYDYLQVGKWDAKDGGLDSFMKALLSPTPAEEWMVVKRETLKNIQILADNIFDDDRHDLRLTKQRALDISETVLKALATGGEPSVKAAMEGKG